MKTYQNNDKVIWFDPHLKLWVMQTIDDSKNQIGDVEYTVNKKLAFDWLKKTSSN